MRKQDLINAVARHLGDRRDAEIAVDAVLSEMMKALVEGDGVTISRFARLYTVERPARTRRNPHTGQPVTVEPSRTIRFKASQTFRDLVNGKNLPEDPNQPLILKRGSRAPEPINEDATYACPQCGANNSDEDGRLSRCHDVTGSGWQCHNMECQWFAMDGEDEPPALVTAP